IEDRSIDPDDLERHSKKTGAVFTLLSAPQMQENAPVLRNYLQAFQSWTHLEVIFDLPEMTVYRGVEKFDSPALLVQRIPNDNCIRYEVWIRDHSHPLPSLATGSTPSDSKTSEGDVAARPP